VKEKKQKRRQDERFEKLAPPAVIGFESKFLKSTVPKPIVDLPTTCSSGL